MIDDHDDGVLSPENLARYEVPGAPAGFAARVLEAVATEPGERRRARWSWRSAALAGLAVAAMAVAWWTLRGERERGGAGERVVVKRETIALATRGLAVAEAGTTLRWWVAPSGDAVVEQPAGSAFYRVERGGSFQVRTPLGVASVTGTSFAVEVTATTPVATSVVVTVYEGGVTFSGVGGQLRLAAGESARVVPDRPPELSGSASGTVVAPQGRALADARARIAMLEREVRELRGGAAVAPAAVGDPGRYYAPSQDTLRKMAESCRIGYDRPELTSEARPVLVDAELAAAVGLAEPARAAINQAYLKVHDRAVDAIRQLYVELTGSEGDAAAALSIEALGQEIVGKSPPEQELAARRRISRERAGLEPAVTAGELVRRPIVERYLRVMMSLGNDAEAAAATVVGARRARELRAHGGVGWNNTVSDYGDCDRRHP